MRGVLLDDGRRAGLQFELPDVLRQIEGLVEVEALRQFSGDFE